MSESESFPDDLDVDYADGEGESPEDYPSVNHKIEKAIEGHQGRPRAVRQPGHHVDRRQDSTLTLYFVKEVADRFDLEVPRSSSSTTTSTSTNSSTSAKHWADEWDLDVIWARNGDIGDYVDEHGLEPGDDIPVDALSEHNQHHVRNLLEYEEDTFPFLLDTYVGNHLLKTVALNDTLEEHDVDAVLFGRPLGRTGGPRRRDVLLAAPRPRHLPAPRPRPAHPPVRRGRRVGGLLELRRAGHRRGLPREGTSRRVKTTSPRESRRTTSRSHRSISPVSVRSGAEVSTDKSAQEPAWLQDMANTTTERAGRAQDKEDLMERLRDLGYM